MNNLARLSKAIIEGLFSEPDILDEIPPEFTISPPYNDWLQLLKKTWAKNRELSALAMEITARQGGSITSEDIATWLSGIGYKHHEASYVRELLASFKEEKSREQIQQLAAELLEQVKDNFSSTQIASFAYLKLKDIQGAADNTKVEATTHLIDKLEAEYRHILQDPNYLVGISWGYPSLDKITNGLNPGDMIVLAARPSVGKTTFALNVAQRNKHRTLFFSLEMTPLQLIQRALDAECGWSVKEGLRKGQLMLPVIEMERCKEWGLYISNNIRPTPDQLLYMASRYKATHDIQLIVVDYIQLLHVPYQANMTRDRELAIISSTLKEIARQCEVPVLVLSQLNRRVEMRGENSKPYLSDLRDSGAIEQDADIVTFLMRGKRNELKILISKNRNGPLGEAELLYQRETSVIK